VAGFPEAKTSVPQLRNLRRLGHEGWRRLWVVLRCDHDGFIAPHQACAFMTRQRIAGAAGRGSSTRSAQMKKAARKRRVRVSAEQNCRAPRSTRTWNTQFPAPPPNTRKAGRFAAAARTRAMAKGSRYGCKEQEGRVGRCGGRRAVLLPVDRRRIACRKTFGVSTA